MPSSPRTWSPPRGRRAPRGVAWGAVLATCGVLLVGCSPAEDDAPPPPPSATTSGLPVRHRPALPDKVFAPTSFWYQKLPAATPRDPQSAAIVKDIVRAAIEHGQPGKPNVTIGTTAYTPPLVTALPTDPVGDVTSAPGCELHPAVAAQLEGLRIPADLRPAGGSDGEVTIYDPQARRYTDLWRVTRRPDGGWAACGGGSLHDPQQTDGRFPFPTGTTATGLPFAGGVIRAEELRRGRIDHVVGISLPYAATAPAHSWPASRSDGRNPRGYRVLRQGQMLRLPADLDLDALNLSRTARTLARAAQEHGFVVWDTAGSVSFRAENASVFEHDPYPQLLGASSAWEALNGADWEGEQPFPLERLEVLPVDYRVR